MKVGDPFLDDTTVGGTISAEHAQKVLGYVSSAVSEGATLACGGERVTVAGECEGGWYLSPAVLTDCRDDMKAVREEIFGAVASQEEVSTVTEAKHEATHSAHELAQELDVPVEEEQAMAEVIRATINTPHAAGEATEETLAKIKEQVKTVSAPLLEKMGAEVDGKALMKTGKKQMEMW